MRTFIELSLPEQVKVHIRERQAAVRGSMSERKVDVCLRWTRITGIHLTLRFLGETSEEQQQELATGLAAIAQEWPPLALRVGQLGGFPGIQRPRVVWLGITGDLDGLRRMQGQVEQLAQSVGFDADPRPYAPHLTIARMKRHCTRAEIQKAGRALSEFAARESINRATARFQTGQLVHMRSELQSPNSVYTPLSVHALAG